MNIDDIMFGSNETKQNNKTTNINLTINTTTNSNNNQTNEKKVGGIYKLGNMSYEIVKKIED